MIATNGHKPGALLDKPIPYNLEAERAVLASCLARPDKLVEVAALLGPTDFHKEENGWLFAALVALHQAGRRVNVLALTDELKRRGRLDAVGGPEGLLALFDGGGLRADHADGYARMVQECSIKRRLITVGGQIGGLGYDEHTEAAALLEQAQALLYAINSRAASEIGTLQEGLGDVVSEVMEMTDGDEDGITGVPTGFAEMNRITGGWQRGDFIVVGGVSKSGKTSFGLDTVYAAASGAGKWQGCEVLIFSAEMSLRQIQYRALATYSGVDLRRLRIGHISDQERQAVTDAWGRINDICPIHIDPTRGQSITDLRARARMMKQRRPAIGLVLCDYLQLFRGAGLRKGANQTEETDSISEGLKWLAGELDVPVIALVQFNNEIWKRDKKVYLPSDFRNSGRIYQDADLIAAVHRPAAFDPDADPHEAEIVVFGSRQGPRGNVKCRWIPEITHFEDQS